jgi:hypothetical protein
VLAPPPELTVLDCAEEIRRMHARYSRHGPLAILRSGACVPALVVILLLAAPIPAQAAGGFSPSVFNFVSLFNDGTARPGGWQEASALLKFFDGRGLVPLEWVCSIRVGMPLRTRHLGRITPEAAAMMTAEIATLSSTRVMHRQTTWMTAAFCVAFKLDMQFLFDEQHPLLGARVNSP